MITIVKDGKEILCSKNTYDIMYKRMGYKILEPKEEKKEEPKEKIKIIEEKTIEKEEIKEPKEIVEKTKATRNKDKKGE